MLKRLMIASSPKARRCCRASALLAFGMITSDAVHRNHMIERSATRRSDPPQPLSQHFLAPESRSGKFADVPGLSLLYCVNQQLGREQRNARFFLPIPVLRKFFRRKFVIALQDNARQGKLGFHGTFQPLPHPSLLRLVANPIPTSLARLLQTPFRRSSTSAALFRPLHPSRRYLQSSTGFLDFSPVWRV